MILFVGEGMYVNKCMWGAGMIGCICVGGWVGVCVGGWVGSVFASVYVYM